jgi:hypothetical protein
VKGEYYNATFQMHVRIGGAWHLSKPVELKVKGARTG